MTKEEKQECVIEFHKSIEQLKEELKKKNKLLPCKENNLITKDGSIREGIGITDKAQILMESKRG